jgi:hypothetical protein
MTDDETPLSAPAPRRRPWKRYLVLGLLFPVVLLALYTWFVVHWDYSNGYRSGLLQKFSEKGWVCKTDEGELWQSSLGNISPGATNIWYFTVRNKAVAQVLDTLVGRQVRLHYSEHRGVPTTCFGDTQYYVDAVTVVKE